MPPSNQPSVPIRPLPGALLGGVAVLSVAAVFAALVSQHLFGLEPCPWCVLQRLIFLAIALVCLLALPWRARAVRGLACALAILLALAGIAAALWQHFVAAATDSCAVSLADRIVVGLHLDTLWPDVFLAGTGCADAAANLLGIPFPFWSAALFALLAGVCAWAMALTLAPAPSPGRRS